MKKMFILLSFLPVFTNAQIINTIAGNHLTGYSGNGGPAVSAEINEPNQVKLDALGNVYIAETGNNIIRKVSPSGVISLIAGNASPAYSGDDSLAINAGIPEPADIAFDKAGNLYIATVGDNRVRKVDTAGIITTFAGNGVAGYSGDGGAATAASLDGPFAITFDSKGNLYVADYYNNCIRKIDTAGIISTFAGNGTAAFAGDGGSALSASFDNPIDVAFDKIGNLFIADISNNRIRKIDTSGMVSTVVGTGTVGFFGDGSSALSAELAYPYALCVDTANNLYITDNENERIRFINTATGIISTVVGDGIAGYTGNGGVATSAEIHNTGGVATDMSGNLYIADFGNNVVRKVTDVGAILGVKSVMVNPNGITYYPNPAGEMLTVCSNGMISQIVITDLLGKTVLSQTCNATRVQLNVADLPVGIYLIRINDSEVRKFVKE